MNKKIHSAILSALITTSVMSTTNTVYASACETIPLGMNLPHEKYFNPAWMFVDLMKGSKPFESHNMTDNDKTKAINTIPMDKNGYPLTLPATVAGFDAAQYVKTVLGEIGLAADKQERYTLYYEGKGEISLGAVDIIDDSTAGKIVFDFPTQRHIDRYLAGGTKPVKFVLSIKSSTEGDHIRNIRVMRPNFTEAESEQSHPLFHERLAGFSTLRFMDSLNTNRSNHETVDDIISKQQATQYKGISPSYIAQIANKNNSNAWINIPHRATDEYIKEFARILKNELNPNLKVYIEYSNEVWNRLFSDKTVKESVLSGQYTYVTAQGCANINFAPEACTGDKIHSKTRLARTRQYTKRSIEIFELFDTVFATDKQRLVSVLAGQASSETLTKIILESLHDSNVNPNNYQVDAYAIAPYFGGKFTRDLLKAQFKNETIAMGSLGGAPILASTVTETQFLDEMAYIIANDIPEIIKLQRDLIASTGMKLFAYEGGQHIAALGVYPKTDAEQVMFDNYVNFTGDINRNPGMKTLYTDYFNTWFNNGGKDFTAFSYVGANGAKSGSWGVLETQDQAIEAAPKYAALRELLDNSCPIDTSPVNTETTIEVNGTVYPHNSNISVTPNQSMSVQVTLNKSDVSSFKHRIPAKLSISWDEIANIQMDENYCKAVGNDYTIYRIECSNPPQGMTINYTDNMVSNLKTSNAYTVTIFNNGDKEVQRQYFVPEQ